MALNHIFRETELYSCLVINIEQYFWYCPLDNNRDNSNKNKNKKKINPNEFTTIPKDYSIRNLFLTSEIKPVNSY